MITTFNTTPTTKSGGNAGLVIALFLAAAATGYYFLVYKPEQDAKLKQK